LYVGAFEELPYDQTPIDFYNLNLKRFPFVADVKFLNVILNEGDCMYIPAYFYYQSRSLGDAKDDLGYRKDSQKLVNVGSTYDSIIFKFQFPSHSSLVDLVFQAVEEQLIIENDPHEFDIYLGKLQSWFRNLY